MAIGFGTYLAALIPGVNPKIAAVCAALFLILANYWGIKKAGKLNLIIVGITLCSLSTSFWQVSLLSIQPTCNLLRRKVGVALPRPPGFCSLPSRVMHASPP